MDTTLLFSMALFGFTTVILVLLVGIANRRNP